MAESTAKAMRAQSRASRSPSSRQAVIDLLHGEEFIYSIGASARLTD